MTSSSTAVRSGRLRWPASTAQRGTLRSLLQHLGVGGPSPRGSKLSRYGPLRGPALRDRGRWAGWRQHQQGGPAEHGGRPAVCPEQSYLFHVFVHFLDLIDSTESSSPYFRQGNEFRKRTPRAHSRSGPECLAWCHMGFKDLKN